MLKGPFPTLRPETDGLMQTPDQNQMLNEEYAPTDLSGDAQTMPTTSTDEQDADTRHQGSGAASGSPNMEPDTGNYGNHDSLGNNDGTETSPETVDPPPSYQP